MSVNTFNVYYKSYKNFLKTALKEKKKFKPLIFDLLKNRYGRNNKGFITMYTRGGGVKRLYKRVCFSYINLWTLGLKRWIVLRVEYDANRSANIMLLRTGAFIFNFDFFLMARQFIYFFNSFYVYKLATENVSNGDVITYFDRSYQDDFSAFESQFARLADIDSGNLVCNIEKLPNTKGMFIRAAGVKCKFMRKFDQYGLLRFPSGERKLFSLLCFATVGRPSNVLFKFKKNYKAGNSRLLNRRPMVRGVAKNPVDHPHGGGEGKSSGGRPSVSRWGWLTKGFVTKRKKVKL